MVYVQLVRLKAVTVPFVPNDVWSTVCMWNLPVDGPFFALSMAFDGIENETI
jgi:hypothetical protein